MRKILTLVVFLSLALFLPSVQSKEADEAVMAANRDLLQTCVPTLQNSMDDPAAQVVAKAYCLGRLRGIVEGNWLTVAMARNQYLPLSMLWCFPKSTIDADLYTAVLAWTIAEEKDYQRIKIKYKDTPNDVLLYVVIQGLKVAYSCPKTQDQ